MNVIMVTPAIVGCGIIFGGFFKNNHQTLAVDLYVNPALFNLKLTQGIADVGADLSFFMKWNALIPELSVSDLGKSLQFYLNVLGFKLEYERADDKFSFISLGNAQLMLEQTNGHWQTGSLEYPFGRGINFQIEVADLAPILERLKKAGHAPFKEPRDQWYRVADGLKGQREFLVQDPDGYLLRFCQSLKAEG